MELLVATASATVLMAGLASAIYVANRALHDEALPVSANRQASAALRQILIDLEHALAFSERSSTAVTFTAPDRNGDAVPETIRYAWSGSPGDPLTYEYNGSPPAKIAEDVQAFDLSFLTRVAGAP